MSSDDGVSVDPNVSLEAVASDSDGSDGVSPSDDGASEDASSDEDDVSSDSVDGASVEGASDSGFDSELELLNIEPIGSNPSIPEEEEEEEEDEEEDESSVILETLSGLDFFVWDFLFFPFFFLEGFLLHAERQ